MFTKEEYEEARERLKDVEITFSVTEFDQDFFLDYTMEDPEWFFENYRRINTPIPNIITADFIKAMIEQEYSYAYRWLEEWLLVDSHTDEDLLLDGNWDITVTVKDIVFNPAYAGEDVLFEDHKPSQFLGGTTKARIF